MTNPLLRDGHGTLDQHDDHDHQAKLQPIAPSQTDATGASRPQDSPRPHNLPLRSSSEERRRHTSRPPVDHDTPVSHRNLDEAAPKRLIQNDTGEGHIYEHKGLEDARSSDQERIGEDTAATGALKDGDSLPGAKQEREKPAGGLKVSRLATQVYTVSYLVLFSFWGTLARLGLQWLTDYPGAPVFPSVWFNFGGSLVFGFLSEDRKLFRDEWGTPTYEQQIQKAKQDEESGGSGSDQAAVDLTAAKKAHLATKKTIPLYVGLATGFCGSFTSFSSFIRDAFLATSNDLTYGSSSTTAPRNGGYSFMALLAVIIITATASLSGLIIGTHLATALEPVTPSLPFLVTRRFADRLAVFLAVGCWVGAVLLAAIPPAGYWRGAAAFALVFAPLGCLLRYYASMWLNGRMNPAFPLGTFAVNVFGTAVLGMAWDLQHVPVGGVIGCQVLQGVEDGFCGCLTTVSTWVSEMAGLRRRQAWMYGGASVVVSFAVMVAVMGGLRWSDGFGALKCVH
ncbi:hypothetical protein VMCG_00064 [Cytospora schulzeri]|uniref:Uncharacterized protein n=1 Tax=Cytospora schulzeri TaxID=448051 RepID=A0A423X7X8_9PEZI|nr:hypothetical protein VMCG_00064 [Valsa malicola]